MFELIIEDTISCAHQLVGYNGPCENLHGHNLKVQIIVEGDKLDDTGLLMDFKDLKIILKEELDKYDHKFLNNILDINPTSENLAKLIFQNIKIKLPEGILLKKVFVWESDNAGAAYKEEKV